LTGGLLGQALEVGARGLPGQQHDAVEAGDDDVRVLVQVRAGLGHVHRYLGFDQRVVDLAAEGAGAAIVLDRVFAAGSNHRTAAGDAQAQVAKAVDRQQVDFLDACGDGGRYANLHIFGQQQRGHAAAIASGQSYDNHFAIMCGLDRLNDVRRVAAGGNRQQHVARLAQGADLLGEDLVVAVVVGDRGNGRAVGGQRDGRQARALALEA
uniref:Nitrite reductase n=1 Tax=Steinernema glaseri TaxID=37863 RepID=A0A1I7ZX06_9BILA